MTPRHKLSAPARLSSHFRPERYKIVLHPDLEKFTFKGEEIISFRLTKPSDAIVLHAHEVRVGRASLRNKNGEIRARSIGYGPKAEAVVIRFSQKIPRGKGELKLYFRGTLNDKMRGFYRSSYELKGKTCYLATTQFEATDARRAFPCVDEPSAKAVFDVTLIVPKRCRAISNTFETSVREHVSGYKVVEFAPTPKMSTYLLAFIVGEFEHIEAKTKEGVVVRVFTTPGKKHQAKFALDVARRTLSYYAKYFGVPYPLPILDLVAIPDFAAGAMENWGAVTYRESALLVDRRHSSLQNKQWVALVIAHELAHQWFGNLVTMEWWTHLWLNEGFASWIEYLAVDHLFPDWDIWTQFVRQDLARALDLDALLNTHPIEVPVGHPHEIGEIFDAVSYSKGASVIRMLADYLGEKDFRKGLRHYLKKHQYANAATDDLWAALEEVSGKPVRSIMKNWTRKSGYPVLRVLDRGKFFEIRQRRFFSSELSRKRARDKTRWLVPVSFLRGGLKKPQERLLRGAAMKFSKPSGGGWLKLNAGEVGVFRTDYPISMLERLKRPIEEKKLDARDRFSIQSDAFALAESGELPTAAAFDLALSYRLEDDYTIWADLAGNIGKVASLLEGGELEETYNAFGREIFSVLAARLGWERKPKETHTQTLLRAVALSQFGRYGDLGTRAEARQRFSSHKNGQRQIAPDLRSAVYGMVARSGGPKEYADFRELYRVATLHEEKNRLGRALGLFREEKLITKTLDFLISGQVRNQDIPGIFEAVWTSPRGRELAWKFLKRHWNFFLARYGRGDHILSRVIRPAENFVSKEWAGEVRVFFRKHEAPSAERTVKQVIERIISNDAWLKRDFRHIESWLVARGR